MNDLTILGLFVVLLLAGLYALVRRAARTLNQLRLRLLFFHWFEEWPVKDPQFKGLQQVEAVDKMLRQLAILLSETHDEETTLREETKRPYTADGKYKADEAERRLKAIEARQRMAYRRFIFVAELATQFGFVVRESYKSYLESEHEQ